MIRNPQRLAAARLGTHSPTPLIAIEERGSVADGRTFVADGQGRVTAAIPTPFMPTLIATVRAASMNSAAASGR